MARYAQIVFIQSSDETPEPERILKEQGEQALFDYLIQWDYGHESECDIRDESSAGKRDHVVSFQVGEDKYIMTYNLGLPYFGLERLI